MKFYAIQTTTSLKLLMLPGEKPAPFPRADENREKRFIDYLRTGYFTYEEIHCRTSLQAEASEAMSLGKTWNRDGLEGMLSVVEMSAHQLKAFIESYRLEQRIAREQKAEQDAKTAREIKEARETATSAFDCDKHSKGTSLATTTNITTATDTQAIKAVPAPLMMSGGPASISSSTPEATLAAIVAAAEAEDDFCVIHPTSHEVSTASKSNAKRSSH